MRVQIARDGEVLGEFEESTIPDGLDSGRLQTSDYYFLEGMKEWRSLSDFVPEAKEVIEAPQADSLSAEIRGPLADRMQKLESIWSDQAKAVAAFLLGLLVVLFVIFSRAGIAYVIRETLDKLFGP